VNAHALSVLEFQRVLDRVAARAGSELGRERVRGLRPGSDRAFLVDELARVDETMAFFRAHPTWSPPVVPDARPALRRLRVEGNVLEPVELHSVGALLSSSRELHRALTDDEDVDDLDFLRVLAGRLHRDRELVKEIEKTVERDGTVLDSASDELRRVRRSLRDTRQMIVRKLEQLLDGLPERIRVSDASVTVRDGRYVIPIRREGKSHVGGIIHGESATGSTLFVEPPVASRLMNQVKELEREEREEIQRILRGFSHRLRPDREELAETQDALVEFDALWARARTAADWRAAPPELLPGDARELEVAGGRHPLLLEKDDHEVVPFDLRLDPDERAMVVSGPNTGGKTVFLKSMGLISLMAQSGVVPPVGPGTRLPVFDDVFADIGDEQSIAESLSTFSAHLENLKELLAGADARSLVLIDEMGTGTDPAEGAALARAILEELVERDALSLVSSHLGQLKHLDREGSGIVNASLQFDPEAMEPTYRLVKGRPGRSYGLAIARRLGFPEEVLDRAEEHRSAGEATVEDLLEKLEQQEKEAEERVAELKRRQEEVARLRAELAEREEAIREVRDAADRDALDEASRTARRRVEEAAREQEERTPARKRDREPPEELEPGDRVRMEGSGTEGVVAEIRDGRAVVEAGGLRLQVPLEDLTVEERAADVDEGAARERRGGGWTGARSVGAEGGPVPTWRPPPSSISGGSGSTRRGSS